MEVSKGMTMTTPQTPGPDHGPTSGANGENIFDRPFVDASEEGQNEQHGPKPVTGAGFFTWLRQLGLQRGTNRWIGGVCSGVAKRLGWDPLLVRIIWFALCFFGGIGIALYGVAWILLPDERTGGIVVEEAVHGRITPGFVLSLLMIIAGTTGSTLTIPFLGVSLIVLLLVGAGITVLATNQRNTKAQEYTQTHTATDPQQPQQTAAFTAAAPNATPAQSTAPPTAAQPPVQPWGEAPKKPATPKPPQNYEVRRPASHATISVIYGLLFLSAAAALSLGFFFPDSWGLTSGQVFLLWVIAADVIVGLSLIFLGVGGRRSSAVGWLLIPLLSLSIIAAMNAPHATTQRWQTGHTTVMSSREYGPNQINDLTQGINTVMGTTTIDLTDWESSDVSGGTECPTQTITLSAAFASVHVLLPDECGWVSDQDMTLVGSSLSGDPAETSSSGQNLRVRGNLTFSSLEIY